MTVLVTGAAGFYGNVLVRRLLDQGKTVRAVIHTEEKARVRLIDLYNRMEIVHGDVRDRARMFTVMQGVEAVIHLVAVPVERGDQTYEAVNHQGTVNVMDAAVASGVQRFIHMSQNGSNSKSFSPFLRSKGKAQDYVEHSPLHWTILHPSLTFGYHDAVFNMMAQLVRLTPFVFPLINGGVVEFQPVAVEDVVEVTIRCLDDDGTIHKHYSLGGPEVLTFGEIEQRVLDAMDAERLLVPVPTAVMLPMVYMMEKVLRGIILSTDLVKLLKVPNVVLHTNALTGTFGMPGIPFKGNHIAYLRKASFGRALRQVLTKQTID